MSGIELKMAKGSDSEEWDRLVEASPHGTIFHNWKWLKIIEKHTHTKLYPIIGFEKDTPIGVYPLFFKKKYFIRAVFSPPPRVSVLYLGPAFLYYDELKQSKKESIYVELQKVVDNFIASELKPNYIYISTPPGLSDARPLKWTGYEVEPMYNYFNDLSGGTEQVWQRLKKKLRQDVERTRKKGVTIEEGSKKELKKIHELLALRYSDQGKIVGDSLQYFLDLYDSFFKKNLRILVARYEGEIITGLIDVYYKDKITSWVGNLKANLRKISPNDLMNWEAIKWACEHGFKNYETMGAANMERLYRYSSKWNSDTLIWFSARKYPHFYSKFLENGYVRLLKPAYTKFKLWGVLK